MNIYPDNTLSDFRIQPPQSIELNEDWEVSLKEIQYPRTWNNVYIIVYIMKEGYYPSANEIIQGGMKEAIDDKSTKDSIDIQYGKIT